MWRVGRVEVQHNSITRSGTDRDRGREEEMYFLLGHSTCSEIAESEQFFFFKLIFVCLFVLFTVIYCSRWVKRSRLKSQWRGFFRSKTQQNAAKHYRMQVQHCRRELTGSKAMSEYMRHCAVQKLTLLLDQTPNMTSSLDKKTPLCECFWFTTSIKSDYSTELESRMNSPQHLHPEIQSDYLTAFASRATSSQH